MRKSVILMIVLTFVLLYISLHGFVSVGSPWGEGINTSISVVLTVIIALWLYHDIYKK